ncbi:hypothetical protein [Streptomyces sp. TRM68416]|uniref:hypothetical protein n=1 Tax=Streptomyces sp. TRM68416 TaxID=2758412 RepID=UPI00166195F7|nr:hypothetical protein [Streptomyces sp. TRM68416]MBD0838820.1 hypothetical protein [Streptomyces sp. TRM68416]
MTQQTITAPEPELLMDEVVDGRVMRLEWRADELWFVAGDRECTVDPKRVLQIIHKVRAERRGAGVTA